MKAIFTVILLCVSWLSFSQKAFDIIEYNGSDKQFTFKLKYADGYDSESSITITEIKSKKATKFKVDVEKSTDAQLIFYRVNKDKKLIDDMIIEVARIQEGATTPGSVVAILKSEGLNHMLLFRRKN